MAAARRDHPPADSASPCGLRRLEAELDAARRAVGEGGAVKAENPARRVVPAEPEAGPGQVGVERDVGAVFDMGLHVALRQSAQQRAQAVEHARGCEAFAARRHRLRQQQTLQRRIEAGVALLAQRAVPTHGEQFAARVHLTAGVAVAEKARRDVNGGGIACGRAPVAAQHLRQLFGAARQRPQAAGQQQPVGVVVAEAFREPIVPFAQRLVAALGAEAPGDPLVQILVADQEGETGVAGAEVGVGVQDRGLVHQGATHVASHEVGRQHKPLRLGLRARVRVVPEASLRVDQRGSLIGKHRVVEGAAPAHCNVNRSVGQRSIAQAPAGAATIEGMAQLRRRAGECEQVFAAAIEVAAEGGRVGVAGLRDRHALVRRRLVTPSLHAGQHAVAEELEPVSTDLRAVQRRLGLRPLVVVRVGQRGAGLERHVHRAAARMAYEPTVGQVGWRHLHANGRAAPAHQRLRVVAHAGPLRRQAKEGLFARAGGEFEFDVQHARRGVMARRDAVVQLARVGGAGTHAGIGSLRLRTKPQRCANGERGLREGALVPAQPTAQRHVSRAWTWPHPSRCAQCLPARVAHRGRTR